MNLYPTYGLARGEFRRAQRDHVFLGQSFQETNEVRIVCGNVVEPELLNRKMTGNKK